jgi:hypothetical protein
MDVEFQNLLSNTYAAEYGEELNLSKYGSGAPGGAEEEHDAVNKLSKYDGVRAVCVCLCVCV